MEISKTVFDGINIYNDTKQKIKTLQYTNDCVLEDIYKRVKDYYNDSALLTFREDFVNKVSEYLYKKDKSLKVQKSLMEKQIADVFFSNKAKIKINNIVFQGYDSWTYDVMFTVNDGKEVFALRVPMMNNMSLECFTREENFGIMKALYQSKKTKRLTNWKYLVESYNTKELGDAILQMIEQLESMNPVGVENMRRIIQKNGWTEVR